jgi:putative colanic acid biosynthesis UDP-glucose lipid carrier transferase
MISQRTRGLLNSVLICQALLAALLLLAVTELTFAFLTTGVPDHWTRYPVYAGMVVLGLVYEAMTRNQASMRVSLWQRDIYQHHRLTLRQTAFALGALLAWLALRKDQAISRSVLLIYLPVLYAALLASNYYLPRWLARTIFGGSHEERTLLLGTAERAARLSHWLGTKEVLGFRTIGLLSDEPEEADAEGLRRVGKMDDLSAVVREHGVTQVILLELPRDPSGHRRLVTTVEKLGVRFLILSNLEEMLEHPVVHIQDDGLRFITLREEPLENPVNRLLKRALDLVISIPVVLLILPPLALVIWLLQRWQSPGPLFFRQTRAGIQNRQFRIIKFRTMCVNNDDESRQAQEHDARVFPAGRWMRRLSIDEIPQFVNVLRGEMSVTGPRPHLVEHNSQFAAQMKNYHIRTFVKPGITGLAQVRGFRGEARSETEIAQRLASDISYLENWRLALDVSIIVRTAWQMVAPPRSAY